MVLYHFSEDPSIRFFEPHVAPSSAIKEPLVWAIDDWHAPMYYFPRYCPRACFWPGDQTTDVDRERLFAVTAARMVIAIESRWLERIRATSLYRYVMPQATFRRLTFDAHTPDSSGHWVSREGVAPIGFESIDDLLGALAAEDIELRVMPSLVELWKTVVQSSLQFSGTRLRNAQGWSEVDWEAIPLGLYAART
jgi:hypothetical protein